VLVPRVHPEILAAQKLPKRLVDKDVWRHRFDGIRAFERYLARNGVLVLKFFLHISKEEQRRRLLDRLEQPAKRWKFSLKDIDERKLWPRYMTAYEDMIRATSHAAAPWHVVPADRKPFARLVVAAPWSRRWTGSIRDPPGHRRREGGNCQGHQGAAGRGAAWPAAQGAPVRRTLAGQPPSD